MITLVLVLLVTVTMTKAEQKENIQDIVKEMVVVEMRETNAKIATLELEMKNMKSKHDHLEREVKIKDDKMKDMNDTFEREMKAKDASHQKLEREVVFLKDPPYTYFSSYQSYIDITSQTITYSSLLYSSTNVVGADMNTSTGIFTSGWGGTYTVSWSLWTGANAEDDAVDIR